MSDTFDMTEYIAPRSDQINAEDLLTGPRIVTITGVRRGSAEQPVELITDEFGPERPYRPSKTMRRVLVAAWGPDGNAYVGRRLTIYRDPEITFGRDKVGGIRISHMSDIPSRLTVALTVTRGRRSPFVVEPLAEEKKSRAKGLPEITDEQAMEFEGRIASAATLDELKIIGAELASWNLGPHQKPLQDAWNARKDEIKAAAAGTDAALFDGPPQ
ncbi:hypothetical protein SEA_FRANKIE_71 [Mycobacterium phage Frankie]|nr:hypothetical protein SEA_FRANKIE_71 [Mycobacterium phage Frankie]